MHYIFPSHLNRLRTVGYQDIKKSQISGVVKKSDAMHVRAPHITYTHTHTHTFIHYNSNTQRNKHYE